MARATAVSTRPMAPRPLLPFYPCKKTHVGRPWPYRADGGAVAPPVLVVGSRVGDRENAAGAVPRQRDALHLFAQRFVRQREFTFNLLRPVVQLRHVV